MAFNEVKTDRKTAVANLGYNRNRQYGINVPGQNRHTGTKKKS